MKLLDRQSRRRIRLVKFRKHLVENWFSNKNDRSKPSFNFENYYAKFKPEQKTPTALSGFWKSHKQKITLKVTNIIFLHIGF